MDTVPQDDVEVQETQAEMSPIELSDDHDGQESQSQERIVRKEEQVPLSALQKERRKRQETEKELQWHKEQMMRPRVESQAQEPDESLQELTTREDLGKFRKDFKREVKREVLEDDWIAKNPERFSEITEKLPEFLKQRPHLAPAIEATTNRYEEAWTLMTALTPKEKSLLKPSSSVKKEAPGNPGNVPKASGMNQAVDVMSMNDSEFNKWRQSQVKRR